MPVIKILLLYEKENAELFVNCHVVSGEGRGEVGKGLPSFSLPVFAYFLETVMLNPPRFVQFTLSLFVFHAIVVLSILLVLLWISSSFSTFSINSKPRFRLIVNTYSHEKKKSVTGLCFVKTKHMNMKFAGISLVHSYVKVPRQHFNLLEVWTLTGPLLHLNSFLLRSFCYKFASVLGITASSLTLEYSEESCNCKTSPNQHPSTTVLDSCCKFFPLMRFVLWSDICTSAPRDIVPQLLWFVQPFSNCTAMNVNI